MARRGRGNPASEPEEDNRLIGSLQFADPSTHVMTDRFNTFNDPYSPGSKGEQTGINSISATRWTSMHDGGSRLLENMNRKKGVHVEEDGE
jgi:hypothetical protein